MPKNCLFFCVCPRIAIYFYVCEKFYELTNIRHNITSAYHPQANSEVQGILFACRIHKQASTCFSTFIPQQMKNDLGLLDMSEETPDFTIEETIEKMENLHQQVLEVAANIKKVQAHQA